jgi:NitT/TauT family transport system substrate-binding protein
VKRLWGIFIALSMIGAVFSAGCLSQREQAGSTVYEVSLNVGDMGEQLKTGNIDGFIAWEPVSSAAVQQGTGKVLAYSREIWSDHPCCVLAAATSSLQHLDKNAVLGIVWAHEKGTDFVNNPRNHDKVVQYIVEHAGVSSAAANMSLKNIRYTSEVNVTSVREYYDELKNSPYLNKKVTDIGYSDENHFFTSFIVQDYSREVKENLTRDPNWKPIETDATINFGVLPANSHDIADYIAEKEGYYRAAGLTVIVKRYANGNALMEGFKTHEIDVGSFGLSPATLKRINDDVKINIIAGVNDDGSSLVVGKDDVITSLSDLTGKTIAIPGYGTVQDIILRKAARQNSLNVSSK